MTLVSALSFFHFPVTYIIKEDSIKYPINDINHTLLYRERWWHCNNQNLGSVTAWPKYKSPNLHTKHTLGMTIYNIYKYNM